MGQKARLGFAGRGGRRAGTTEGALLTHRAGIWDLGTLLLSRKTPGEDQNTTKRTARAKRAGGTLKFEGRVQQPVQGSPHMFWDLCFWQVSSNPSESVRVWDSDAGDTRSW